MGPTEGDWNPIPVIPGVSAASAPPAGPREASTRGEAAGLGSPRGDGCTEWCTGWRPTGDWSTGGGAPGWSTGCCSDWCASGDWWRGGWGRPVDGCAEWCTEGWPPRGPFWGDMCGDCAGGAPRVGPGPTLAGVRAGTRGMVRNPGLAEAVRESTAEGDMVTAPEPEAGPGPAAGPGAGAWWGD